MGSNRIRILPDLSAYAEGLVNTFLVNIGALDAGNMIYFLGNSKWWRGAYYIINIWKETGWQTVIFMATLAGINTELYEAASIDGAGRWGKMSYVTFPALQNTILTVLILNLAKVMNLSSQHSYYRMMLPWMFLTYLRHTSTIRRSTVVQFLTMDIQQLLVCSNH